MDALTAWSIAKDFGVPLLAAMIGALLAYVPAARLARKASDELLKRDREERAEAELIHVRRSFVKLTLLANTLGTFRQDIEGMIQKATNDGNDQMPLWQRLSAFAGIEDESAITFDADELAPFIAKGRPDMVDALLLLQRRHMALVQGLRSFARHKTELHYMTTPHGETTRDETLVSTTHARMPVQLARVFHLKADELELFSSALRAQANEYAGYAMEVAAQFNDLCRAHFAKGKIPLLTHRDAPDQ